MIPGITGFLFAGVDMEGFHLYQLGADGSIAKYDDFVTDGSGMMYATGVLEGNYKKDLSVDEGIQLAVKAISASMERDTASGGGLDVVIITKDGTKKAMSKQLETKLV